MSNGAPMSLPRVQSELSPQTPEKYIQFVMNALCSNP